MTGPPESAKAGFSREGKARGKGQSVSPPPLHFSPSFHLLIDGAIFIQLGNTSVILHSSHLEVKGVVSEEVPEALEHNRSLGLCGGHEVFVLR